MSDRVTETGTANGEENTRGYCYVK